MRTQPWDRFLPRRPSMMLPLVLYRMLCSRSNTSIGNRRSQSTVPDITLDLHALLLFLDIKIPRRLLHLQGDGIWYGDDQPAIPDLIVCFLSFQILQVLSTSRICGNQSQKILPVHVLGKIVCTRRTGPAAVNRDRPIKDPERDRFRRSIIPDEQR